MSSVYVICCIFLQTFQTYFLHIGKQCGLRPDVIWSRRIDVDTTSFWCYVLAGKDKDKSKDKYYIAVNMNVRWRIV